MTAHYVLQLVLFQEALRDVRPKLTAHTSLADGPSVLEENTHPSNTAVTENLGLAEGGEQNWPAAEDLTTGDHTSDLRKTVTNYNLSFTLSNEQSLALQHFSSWDSLSKIEQCSSVESIRAGQFYLLIWMYCFATIFYFFLNQGIVVLNEILVNCMIRHNNNKPMLTVKRKKWSDRMTACDTLSLIEQIIAIYSHRMRFCFKNQWNDKKCKVVRCELNFF